MDDLAGEYEDDELTQEDDEDDELTQEDDEDDELTQDEVTQDDLAGEYEVTPKDENTQDHDQTIIVELEPNLNTVCYGFKK